MTFGALGLSDGLGFAVRVVCGITAVWLVAWLCVMALRRSSAAVRHRVWALSMVMALVLPMAALVLPEWRAGVIALPAASAPTVAQRGDGPRTLDQTAIKTGGQSAEESAPGAKRPAAVEGGAKISVGGSGARSADGAAALTLSAGRQTDSWGGWVVATWLLPAMWLVARQVLSLLAARNLRRGAVPIEDSGVWERGWESAAIADLLGKSRAGARRSRENHLATAPCLLESPSAGSPICLGWLRPCIVLPQGWREWPAGQLEAVLTHELAHVARRDVLWQMLARLACAVYWFHPLAWAAAWQIRLERELACDDWVLRGGESSTRYARWLLDVAVMLSGKAYAEGAGVAMASGTHFEHRIAAILDGRRRRFPLSRRMASIVTLLAVAILSVVGIVSPLAPLKAAAQGTTTTRPTTLAAEPEHKTVPLSGSVVDEKGNPVGDVLVEVDRGSWLRTTRSAGDGQFTLQIAEGGGSLVRATTSDGRRQAFIEQKPPAGAGQGLRLVLKPAREFAVMVVDDRDRPVAGASVAFNAFFLTITETTDAAGKAMLRVPADVKPDYVVAMKDGLGMDYAAFWRKDDARTDPYRLAADHSGPVKLVLNGAKRVAVRVIDGQGQPLSGVEVHPWTYEKPKRGHYLNASFIPEFLRTTDARGIAEFEVPADNINAVIFWTYRDGYCATQRWLWDAKSGAAEVRATMLRMLTVRGRVVDDAGRGVGGALVMGGGRNQEIDRFGDETTTADDGSFQMRVNPEMYYIFVASKGRLVSKAHTEMIHRQVAAAPMQLTLQPATRLVVRATGGPENLPVANAITNLYQEDTVGYQKLPKEQQFPESPHNESFQPAIVLRHAEKDENGIAEYWIRPGDYNVQVFCGGSNEGPTFTLSDTGECTIRRSDRGHVRDEVVKAAGPTGIEIPVRFPDAKPELRFLKGRVVLKERPDTGVPEAGVQGVDTSILFPYDATADAQGTFAVRRGGSDFYLWAATADRKLQGIVVAGPGEQRRDVPVGPTASARGRLLDPRGQPLAGQTITFGVRVTALGGAFGHYFGASITTAADGSFLIDGLVPGFEYALEAVAETGTDGLPLRWQLAGTVKPADVQRVELGDTTLRELPRARTKLEKE